MDYSQKGLPTTEPNDFFTSGVGDIPADQNIYEKENNLDLTSNQSIWNNSKISGESVRNLGNMAISSSESLTELRGGGQLLKEMVEPMASPAVSTPSVPNDIMEKISFDASLIRTDGDRINKSAIKEVGSVISEFTNTGNAADFYATVRGDDEHPGMVRVNLKNSYNREVA